jgi:hypothetical protein
LLEEGRVEALNEIWDSEGREPHQLVGNDDDMPDLEDARLERCIKAYVEKNWLSLQYRHEQAKQRWEEIKQQTVVVNGVPLRPLQRVRFHHPPNFVEEFVFHGLDNEGRIYLEQGGGFQWWNLRPVDRLEPLYSE